METQRREAYRVTLSRGGPPEALGILTARYSTAVKGLVITGVLQTDCPVHHWNEEHPQHRVMPGHAIIAVNGAEEIKDMLTEFHTASHVELVISPHLTAVQRCCLREARRLKEAESLVNGMVRPVHVDNEDLCSICLDHEPSLELVELPCGHVFHKSCMTKWLMSSQARRRCPLCKRSL